MIAVAPSGPLHDGAVAVVFAKDQPPYVPLPAAVDAGGCVLTEWEFSAEELAAVLAGGRIRVWVHTFRQPLQPIALEVVDRDGQRVIGESTSEGR